MPHLNIAQRNQIIGMKRANVSSRHIAQHFNCSKSTVNNVVAKFNNTGSVNDLPGRGRPRKTSQDEDEAMVEMHIREPFLPATQTANQHDVSADTVRRRLKQGGLRCRRPFIGNSLTPRHREARLQWAVAHARWYAPQWDNVLFSDESKFNIFFADGRLRVWRRDGERFSDKCVLESNRFGGGGVLVWAGISTHHRTELVVVEGTLTAQSYVDILRQQVVPMFQNNQDLRLFQHDNARPHSARLTQEFLRQQNIDTLEWPAVSPDMSPIEHFWDELGRRVRKRGVLRTVNELEVALREEYFSIPQEVIARLTRSMTRRVRACRQAEGGHTQY